MNVQVQSEGGIVIRYPGENNLWGTTASAGMKDDGTGVKLYPVSTKDLRTWYHSAAAQAKASTSTGEYDDVSNSVVSGDNIVADSPYAVMKEFQIRSSSQNTADASYGLYVSDIKVTYNGATPTANIATALRVGVRVLKDQVGQTNAMNPEIYKIFAPAQLGTEDLNKPSTSYKIAGQGDLFTPETTYTSSNATILGDTYSIPNEKTQNTNEPYSYLRVQIFIWFEGEDHNLYSDNFNNLDLDVSVSFTSLSGGKQAPAVDLTDASATGTTKVVGGQNYYAISGKTLNNKQLYTTELGDITSSSSIFVFDDDATPTKATDVTAKCKLPAASG